MVLWALIIAAVPHAATPAEPSPAAAAREALLRRSPGVRFHESGGRTRAAYGVPLSGAAPGSTARAQAEEWLAEFAVLFGEPSPDLALHSAVELRSGRTIVSFRQAVDGLPVENAMYTVVIDGLPSPRVVYASARAAIRPPSGLGPALLGAAQAQLIARAHPSAPGLTAWRVGADAAIYDDPPLGSATARRMFTIVGEGPTGSRTFYVDARLGTIARHHSNVLHSDVTGTVTGHGSGERPLEPDTWGTAGSPPTGTLACPNGAVPLGAMRRMRVNACSRGTSTVIASAYTDQEGGFALSPGQPSAVDVKALLEGPYWRLRDGSGEPSTSMGFCCNVVSPGCCPPESCCHDLAAPFGYPGNPVPPAAAPIVFHVNSAPTEFGTAAVNAFRHVEHTNRYFLERLSPASDQHVPWLHDVVDVIVNYAHENWGHSAWAVPVYRTLWFGKSFAGGPENPNFAYSTIVSHEYGHYLIYWMRGIPTDTYRLAFHEGFGDTLACLVHDTTDYGANSAGCGTFMRQPLTYTNPYPDCGNLASYHDQGQSLTHVWLDIMAAFKDAHGLVSGAALAQQLHVGWTMITDGPEASTAVCGAPQPDFVGRSVHPQTLLEVLVADDDDGVLANGTPHHCLICTAFAERGIPCPPDLPSCPGRPAAGFTCEADCNEDGELAPSDIQCFHSLVLAGSARADCNGDRSVNVADWACFLERYQRGCPDR